MLLTRDTEQVGLYTTEVRGSLDTTPGSKLPRKCNVPARYQSGSNGLLQYSLGVVVLVAYVIYCISLAFCFVFVFLLLKKNGDVSKPL